MSDAIAALTREERKQVWYEEECRRRLESYFFSCAVAFASAGLADDMRRNFSELDRLQVVDQP